MRQKDNDRNKPLQQLHTLHRDCLHNYEKDRTKMQHSINKTKQNHENTKKTSSLFVFQIDCNYF